MTQRYDILIKYPYCAEQWHYGLTREEIDQLTAGYTPIATIRLK